MHVLSEPLPQLPEIAALELLVEVAEIGLHALPELERDDVAERVGWEPSLLLLGA